MSEEPNTVDDGLSDGQRKIHDLLTQETRHLILQFVLGHPKHLPSFDELAYMIPKDKSEIRDQLDVLIEHGILMCYQHPPNEDVREFPSQFYGLTEHGVGISHQFNYLRGLPIALSLYDNTRLSEISQRHLDAPRPALPESVTDAML